jgi:hypothetical protein
MSEAFSLVRGGDKIEVVENHVTASGATGIVRIEAKPDCVSSSAEELVFTLKPWADRMEGCTLVCSNPRPTWRLLWQLCKFCMCALTR